jgi:hypothetical protein
MSAYVQHTMETMEEVKATFTDSVKASFETAKAMVETGPEGTECFIEISSKPLTGCLFTADKKNPMNPELNDISITVLAEPAFYPEKPEDLCDIKNEGYAKYISRCDKKGQEERFTRFEWKKNFANVREVILKCIEEYGGIKCYKNGDMSDESEGNLFIMHVCDILNVFVMSYNKKVPELYLKTCMLSELEEDTKNDLLDKKVLNLDEMKFLFQEIDFFYIWFCYWEKKSFLLIRTEVDPRNNRSFEDAVFFTKDAVFCRHQDGKLKQMYQDRISINDNVMPYRYI